MTTLTKVIKTETEYSKLWIQTNPELFASSILSFLEQHPSDVWAFSATQTSGFFTLHAELYTGLAA